jgi:hypothetical protein
VGLSFHLFQVAFVQTGSATLSATENFSYSLPLR